VPILEERADEIESTEIDERVVLGESAGQEERVADRESTEMQKRFD
jgi:hypothetical protein